MNTHSVPISRQSAHNQTRARSYAYLCRKAGLPEPTGLAIIEPTEPKPRVMFEVCRADVPWPMALFASESWAQQWIGTLSQPARNYKIRPVDIEPRFEVT